jgi:hypothetical protein
MRRSFGSAVRVFGCMKVLISKGLSRSATFHKYVFVGVVELTVVPSSNSSSSRR